MKKVVIIGRAYPFKGGLAAFNQRLAEELQWKGIHTVLFTFSLQYLGVLYPGRTQFSPDVSSGSLDIRPRITSINPFNWIKVAREIAELKPDVVICTYRMPSSSLLPIVCQGVIKDTKDQSTDRLQWTSWKWRSGNHKDHVS